MLGNGGEEWKEMKGRAGKWGRNGRKWMGVLGNGGEEWEEMKGGVGKWG